MRTTSQEVLATPRPTDKELIQHLQTTKSEGTGALQQHLESPKHELFIAKNVSKNWNVQQWVAIHLDQHLRPTARREGSH